MDVSRPWKKSMPLFLSFAGVHKPVAPGCTGSVRRFLMARALVVMGGLVGGLLSACGGGGGDVTSTLGAAPGGLMVDSFGRAVPEADFGFGNVAASGVDGTASEEVALANATVKIIDNAGHSVLAKTDAQGYYRARVDGFIPPLIANVARSDGQLRFSVSITPPKVRGFTPVNITSLTDKLVSDLAVTAGYNSPAQLSAATVATLTANASVLPAAKAKLNTQFAALLADAGLSASTFDPVSLAFQPVTSAYAKLLSNLLTGWTTTGTTVLTARYSLGGSVTGLGALAGLTLVNGTETLGITASSTAFTFATRTAPSAAYNVTVGSQPAGAVCGVTNGSGAMNSQMVNNLLVVCSTVSETLGGSITGLGSAAGLVLATAGQTVTVAPSATGFVFSTPIPRGISYAVTVQAQPASFTCSVSNGTGYLNGNGPVSTVKVSCSLNSYALGGTVTGVFASGLSLTTGEQTVAVAATSTSFAFPTTIAAGTAYAVTIKTSPRWQTCTVSQDTGTITIANISNVAVTCVAKEGNVTTLAGSGVAGFNDGTAGIATFNGPAHIALSANGVLLVVDEVNERIRQVGANGTVSTLAGNGTTGAVDGYGTFASFTDPRGIAVDKDGNTYVSEMLLGNRLRKIVYGSVSTQAGPFSGDSGFADGLGAAARFFSPAGLAVDTAGNVYLADSANQRIRKISPVGQVTTLAGTGVAGFLDGAGTAAQFNSPEGLAVDGAGNVYVADTGNHRVRKITPAGVVSTVAGTGVAGLIDGLATGVNGVAAFNAPRGIALDSAGVIYLTDTGNQRIRRVVPEGIVSTVAGSSAGFLDGTAFSAQFSGPLGIAVDNTGNLLVGDVGNNRIRSIVP